MEATLPPLFRLKLDYTSRIPMLSVDEFHTLSSAELDARSAALAIPVFGPRRTIIFCQGLHAFPDIPVAVQEFSPVEGDAVDKIWTDKNGEVKTALLRPFALADPVATSNEYRAMLEHWISWARARSDEHYQLMAELFVSEEITTHGKIVLGHLGPFSLAYTLKMGSAWLSGPDTLDMKPIFDEGYPLQGKVALPTMVKAQFDALSSLLMTRFQRDIESSLNALETASDWQVIFVTVAVLGDLVSRMKSDRIRHAKQRGVKELYTEPESVTMAEAGLKEVVARFRRFQKRFDVPRVLEESRPGVRRIAETFSWLLDEPGVIC